MIYLAWVVLFLQLVSLMATSYLIGIKYERKPYSWREMVTLIISNCLLIPLIGRVLGWW